MARQPDGVAWTIEHPDSATSRRTGAPAASVELAIQQLAPLVKGRKTSMLAMSNEMFVMANTREASFTPSRARTSDTMFISDRCERATPFGRPVEPDV